MQVRKVVDGERLLAHLDRALAMPQPALQAAVRARRKRHPDEQPADVLRAFERSFLSGVTISGGASGATAAAPAVGTGPALTFAVADAGAFLVAASTLALTAAEIHGVAVHEVERRRLLVLSVLLGDSAVSTITKVAGRTGSHWGKFVAQSVPLETINAVNKLLGRHFVTRYGTKQGILVLGKAMPFGFGLAIGAGGNYLAARSVVAALKQAFGAPPSTWPADDLVAPIPLGNPQPCSGKGLVPDA